MQPNKAVDKPNEDEQVYTLTNEALGRQQQQQQRQRQTIRNKTSGQDDYSFKLNSDQSRRATNLIRVDSRGKQSATREESKSKSILSIMRFSNSTNSLDTSGLSSTTSQCANDDDDCRQKIYNHCKRSTSYGGIGGIGKSLATSKSNFKKFSLSNQDYILRGNRSNSSSGNFSANSGHQNNGDPENPIDPDDQQIGVSDIIGSFGLFQALVLLFSGLREGLVGYDALVMSIILQPDNNCKWPLVCQNYWLMVIIESAYFLGLVTGNLTWGFCADKFGRRPAYLVAHTISILFGSLAIFMPSVYLFAVCRFLTAFGCIGYNIIYSIQVELIGLRHRSFSTILNHLGWGLGVICVPLVDHLMDDYRAILSIAPILSLVMFPWAFWLPESSRWLMANERFDEARDQLLRAARYNGRKITSRIEKSIWVLEQRVRSYKLAQLQQPGAAKGSYKMIFTNPKLLRDTSILAYLAFVGHLFYYVQTLNFAHVRNLSTEANFISSGAGEWSLVDSDLIPALDTVLIITTNNGLGTLSSLLLIFIALIVNQEVYPTIVRQTGTSLIGSIGESGSLLAPLLIYISSVVGPDKTNATFTFFCVFGIVVTQFLSKTDDIELPDT